MALITGATSGIGEATALGAKVALAAWRVERLETLTRRIAEDVVNTITQAGGHARAFAADSSDLEQMRRFFEEVARVHPQIDILVNNVGTASAQPQPLGTVDPAEYDHVFNLNTRGLFFTSQEALKIMRDGGRIVNISSVASRLTAPGRSVYAGTKGAIEAFTRVWAAELGSRGITVNSVSPGTVETERTQVQLSPEMRARFVKMTPLARMGAARRHCRCGRLFVQCGRPLADRPKPPCQRWTWLTHLFALFAIDHERIFMICFRFPCIPLLGVLIVSTVPAASQRVTPARLPLPLPGVSPVAPDRLRAQNPWNLPMNGLWRFHLTHGQIQKGTFARSLRMPQACVPPAAKAPTLPLTPLTAIPRHAGALPTPPFPSGCKLIWGEYCLSAR